MRRTATDCRLFESYAYVSGLIEDKNTSIRHLRQLLFGSHGEDRGGGRGESREDQGGFKGVDNAAADESSADDANSDASDDSTVPRGHGRNGAEAYQGRRAGPRGNPTLRAGDACPACGEVETVYDKAPGARWVRHHRAAAAVRDGLSVVETPMQLVRPGLHCGVACRGRSGRKYDATAVATS